jgi:hypothetical protein
MKNNQNANDIRDKVKLTQAKQLYTIKDESDQLIDFETVELNYLELVPDYADL